MQSTVEVSAQIKRCSDQQVVIEVAIPLVGAMLSGEEVVQAAVNAVGLLGTRVLLKRFDTDGSPIAVGDIRFSSKGMVEKEYETPYGKVSLARHVYQSATVHISAIVTADFGDRDQVAHGGATGRDYVAQVITMRQAG